MVEYSVVALGIKMGACSNRKQFSWVWDLIFFIRMQLVRIQGVFTSYFSLREAFLPMKLLPPPSRLGFSTQSYYQVFFINSTSWSGVLWSKSWISPVTDSSRDAYSSDRNFNSTSLLASSLCIRFELMMIISMEGSFMALDLSIVSRSYQCLSVGKCSILQPVLKQNASTGFPSSRTRLLFQTLTKFYSRQSMVAGLTILPSLSISSLKSAWSPQLNYFSCTTITTMPSVSFSNSRAFARAWQMVS